MKLRLIVLIAWIILTAVPTGVSASGGLLEQVPFQPISSQGTITGSTVPESATAVKTGFYDKGSINLHVLGSYLNETWGFNNGKEHLAGPVLSLGYCLLPRLAILVEMSLLAVSQDIEDTFLGGVSPIVRWHYYTRGDLSFYFDAGFGVSFAGARVPAPKGTNFNFLIHAGPGVAYRFSHCLCLTATFRYMHISNASISGSHRNPDIDTLGGQAGLMASF